MQAAKLK